MMLPVELLLSRLPDAAKSGNGWKARCPAHEDRNPSLTVWENEDGSAGVKCYAGCDRDAVLSALGLTWRDLKPMSLLAVNGRSENKLEKGPSVVLTAKQHSKNGVRPTKTYPTADAAASALASSLGFGPPVAAWPYHNANGTEVARVLRWDTPDGKVIRPVCREGSDWRIGSLPLPRPLYRLPEVMTAGRVFVCEGEKAADALRSIGLVATTSPHGADSAGKADWSPLAGKEIIILPDHDAPGWKYAETVRDLLAALTPAPVVKLLALEGLPDKGDVFDWIEQRDAIEPAELRRQLEALADAAPLFVPDNPASATGETWQPFPVDALPEPARGFIVAASKALHVDPSFVALPLLSMLAAAVGNFRRVRLKPGWTEPACLWTVIVGESGDGKSAPLELVLKSVRHRQRMRMKEFETAWQQYERELASYQRDLSAFQKGKLDNPPEAPAEPTPVRLVVDDTTVEALAPLLVNNPRGLLAAKDELSGLLASFDRYAAGKGGDASKWLELFGGRSITVDRKGAKRPLFIPRALVSVTGGIQPGILRRLLTTEHRESGLASRLLFTCPPRQKRTWTEAEITRDAEDSIARLLDRLLSLEPQIDDLGDPEPVIVDLSPRAKREWIAFYNDHATEHVALTGDLSAAWSKLLGYAARLALVVHFIRWSADDSTLQSVALVDVESIRAGIELSRWFGNEAKRVYALFTETENQRTERELVDWIRLRGGTATVREVRAGIRRYRDSQALAESALDALVKAGFGAWATDATEGRPRTQFRLVNVVNVNGSPIS